MSATLTVMMAAKKKAARKLVRDYNEIQYLRSSKKPLEQFAKMAYTKAEQQIFEELQIARPNFSFVSKILGTKAGSDTRHRWLVNGLTSYDNFIYGLPYFAISIALEQDGVIIAGVIDVVAMGETYYASKGEGAWLERNTHLANDTLRLRVCASDGKKSLLFVDANEAANHGINRVIGCAASGIAYVAAGKADSFVASNVHLCDVAAGILLVREAGGKVDDYTADAGNVVNKIVASSGGTMHALLGR